MRFAGISLSNYMDGFDTTLLSNTAQRARSQETRAGMVGEGKITSAGIAGTAEIASAKLGAAANKAAGQAAGNAAIFGGAMNGLSTFGTGAINKYMGNKSPTFPNTTDDGYPLGRGSDGKAYGGFGGQNGNFTPPKQLPNGNFTFG